MNHAENNFQLMDDDVYEIHTYLTTITTSRYLPNKRGIFLMFKILWKYIILKLNKIMNNKPFSLLIT
jgi:hypothetical protein